MVPCLVKNQPTVYLHRKPSVDFVTRKSPMRTPLKQTDTMCKLNFQNIQFNIKVKKNNKPVKNKNCNKKYLLTFFSQWKLKKKLVVFIKLYFWMCNAAKVEYHLNFAICLCRWCSVKLNKLLTLLHILIFCHHWSWA